MSRAELKIVIKEMATLSIKNYIEHNDFERSFQILDILIPRREKSDQLSGA